MRLLRGWEVVGGGGGGEKVSATIRCTANSRCNRGRGEGAREFFPAPPPPSLPLPFPDYAGHAGYTENGRRRVQVAQAVRFVLTRVFGVDLSNINI